MGMAKEGLTINLGKIQDLITPICVGGPLLFRDPI
jgi:hypothetical protein